jgi:hypothetical protein
MTNLVNVPDYIVYLWHIALIFWQGWFLLSPSACWLPWRVQPLRTMKMDAWITIGCTRPAPKFPV